MDKDHRSYTYSLAKRYQARENLRCLKLMSYLVATVVATIVVNGILTSIVKNNYVSANGGFVLMAISEALLNLNALWITLVTIMSMPAWRSAFLQSVPLLKKLGSIKKPNKIHDKKKQETDQYFEQLKKSW
ncbi:unnamed protein product [Caenorhabditis auriculariae]|uniref:Uncharacterized protein n=1 Tax=Caenorhabditis auriculariae TaxID=2777116 RepID=A0A8S1HI47_9PELO|nr:unnamed protein product [Caenorhabditis auriculariae]